jgi:hypothetical protein
MYFQINDSFLVFHVKKGTASQATLMFFLAKHAQVVLAPSQSASVSLGGSSVLCGCCPRSHFSRV